MISTLARTFTTRATPHVLNTSKKAPWDKNVTEIVKTLLGNPAVVNIFKGQLATDRVRANRNMDVMKELGCFPLGTYRSMESSGETFSLPQYFNVGLEEERAALSFFIDETDPMDYTVPPPSYSESLQKAKQAWKKFRSEEEISIVRWPDSKVIRHNGITCVASERRFSLDVHEMIAHMWKMSDQELEIYAKTVTSFSVVTDCLCPNIESLSLRPCSENMVIIKNFNTSKGTAYGCTHSNRIDKVIFGLNNAIEMGIDYNAPPRYIEKLSYARNNLVDYGALRDLAVFFQGRQPD